MEKKIYDLNIDNRLDQLIPPLRASEWTLLLDSIVENGCEVPLIVWNGTIVDGHNRYRICRDNNIPFAVEEKQFGNIDEAKKWVILNQLGRRNLSDYQKCELVIP